MEIKIPVMYSAETMRAIGNVLAEYKSKNPNADTSAIFDKIDYINKSIFFCVSNGYTCFQEAINLTDIEAEVVKLFYSTLGYGVSITDLDTPFAYLYKARNVIITWY